jgi:hypothetical protein
MPICANQKRSSQGLRELPVKLLPLPQYQQPSSVGPQIHSTKEDRPSNMMDGRPPNISRGCHIISILFISKLEQSTYQLFIV